MIVKPQSQSTKQVIAKYDAVRAMLDAAMAASISDPIYKAIVKPIFEYEARLIDAKRYDDWLSLYDDDTFLWIPAHPDDHPGKDQALTFDDKRRLRERVWHMTDPKAWAITKPEPMTMRQIGPVAAWPYHGEILATSTITYLHVRRGPAQVLYGRQVMRLKQMDEKTTITGKILVLPELSLGESHVGWIL